MSDMFTQVVESLLAGQVICRYTQQQAFEFLDDEANFEKVHDYLFQIGRKLRRTVAEDGFLLAHADLGSSRAKREARAAFEEVSRYIRPFVYWLSFAKKLSPSGNPLKAGDLLDEAELLRAIGESAELTRDLDSLCRLKPFLSDARKPAGQLARVLQKLVDMNYFVVVGHSKTLYKATARLSLFYDTLDFIREYEQLSQPEEGEEQMELLDG